MQAFVMMLSLLATRVSPNVQGSTTAASVWRAPVCGASGACVVRETRAGKDAAGHTLTVLSVEHPAADEKEALRHPAQDYWLVTGDGPRASLRRLLGIRNDGYGIAGVGEDEVKVADNALTHFQGGGSSQRSGYTYEFQLGVRRLRATSRDLGSEGRPSSQRRLGGDSAASRAVAQGL